MLHHRPISPYKVAPDYRFRRLLGEPAWARLPVGIRKRFSKKLSCGASVVYQGVVVAMRMNLAGRALAQLARLFGGPLPLSMSMVDQPAIVSVTEDQASGGQFWMRQYGRANYFPQVVHSSKRFAGPTGIEEYIGSGIGMALRVSAEPQKILFKSDHYFLQVGRHRLRLPAWMTPANLTIGHHDLGDGRFLFSLTLTSRLFGEMIHQDALFQDAPFQDAGV